MPHQVCLEVGKVLAHRDALLLPFHEGGQLLRHVHRPPDDSLHRVAELGRVRRFEEHAAFPLPQALAQGAEAASPVRVEQVAVPFVASLHGLGNLRVGAGSPADFGRDGRVASLVQVADAGEVARVTHVHGVGDGLHTYTIVDAIRDRNVLPFRVDYVRTMKEKEGVESSLVWDIEREKALQDPRRIRKVAAYVLEHFDQQTKRGKTYRFSTLANVEEVAADKKKTAEERRTEASLSGFNSILAAQKIACAKLYYRELRRLAELIEKFIDRLTPDSKVDDEWKRYVEREKREQFERIVEDEGLKREEAAEFIEDAFRRGYVPEYGMELDGIMPPLNPFDRAANREGKMRQVVERLKGFFNRFFDISGGAFKRGRVYQDSRRSLLRLSGTRVPFEYQVPL